MLRTFSLTIDAPCGMAEYYGERTSDVEKAVSEHCPTGIFTVRDCIMIETQLVWGSPDAAGLASIPGTATEIRIVLLMNGLTDRQTIGLCTCSMAGCRRGGGKASEWGLA
jgi:hypothetical protein